MRTILGYGFKIGFQGRELPVAGLLKKDLKFGPVIGITINLLMVESEGIKNLVGVE